MYSDKRMSVWWKDNSLDDTINKYKKNGPLKSCNIFDPSGFLQHLESNKDDLHYGVRMYLCQLYRNLNGAGHPALFKENDNRHKLAVTAARKAAEEKNKQQKRMAAAEERMATEEKGQLLEKRHRLEDEAAKQSQQQLDEAAKQSQQQLKLANFKEKERKRLEAEAEGQKAAKAKAATEEQKKLLAATEEQRRLKAYIFLQKAVRIRLAAAEERLAAEEERKRLAAELLEAEEKKRKEEEAAQKAAKEKADADELKKRLAAELLEAEENRKRREPPSQLQVTINEPLRDKIYQQLSMVAGTDKSQLESYVPKEILELTDEEEEKQWNDKKDAAAKFAIKSVIDKLDHDLGHNFDVDSDEVAEITKFYTCLMENYVFDMGFRVDYGNNSIKCLCPCW